MTFQKNFVVKKLEETSDYLKEIETLFLADDGEILADSNRLHAAERLLQLLVDTIIDINEHFIKELGFKISEDYQGTFTVLAENNIISSDFAKKIAPVVGLRNRIIHRYEEIDKPLFIRTFRNNLSDFKEYLILINKYIETIT